DIPNACGFGINERTEPTAHKEIFPHANRRLCAQIDGPHASKSACAQISGSAQKRKGPPRPLPRRRTVSHFRSTAVPSISPTDNQTEVKDCSEYFVPECPASRQ